MPFNQCLILKFILYITLLFCGLESIVEYINQLHFTKEDVEFLRSKNTFSEEFLDLLE